MKLIKTITFSLTDLGKTALHKEAAADKIVKMMGYDCLGYNHILHVKGISKNSLKYKATLYKQNIFEIMIDYIKDLFSTDERWG